MDWKLHFISEEDFTEYVKDKIELVDNLNNDGLMQCDKTNIYKDIFQYIAGCHVPDYEEAGGWDVIFKNDSGIALPNGDVVHTVYAEMKNKRSTMNSPAMTNSYLKMQSQLLDDDDCACFFVETNVKKSQNIKWLITVCGKRISHDKIRLVSLDQFYALVTGQEDALYQIHMMLDEMLRTNMRINL